MLLLLTALACYAETDADGMLAAGEGFGVRLSDGGRIQTKGRRDYSNWFVSARKTEPPECRRQRFAEVATDGFRICGVTPDRDELACWSSAASPLTPPGRLPISGAHSVSMSSYPDKICVLDDQGTVRLVSLDFDGMAKEQDTWDEAEFVETRCESGYTCALTTDGTFLCRGSDEEGPYEPLPGEWVRSAADPYRLCLQASSGEVTCIGWTGAAYDQVPPGPYVDFAIGGHFYGVDEHGTLTSVQVDSRGGDTNPLPEGPFRAVSASVDTFCWVPESGQPDCMSRRSVGSRREGAAWVCW